MTFKLPTLTETREFLLAVGKVMLPDRNWGNLRSYFGKRTTFFSAGITQLHDHIDHVGRDVMPDTAGDDGPIDRWGNIKGVLRKGATPARKAAAARVTGASGTAIPAGTQLAHQASGLLFQISNTTAIPGVAPFQVDADIVAVDLGTQTRLLAGEALVFVATPVGLDTNVVLSQGSRRGRLRHRAIRAVSAALARVVLGRDQRRLAVRLRQVGARQATERRHRDHERVRVPDARRVRHRRRRCLSCGLGCRTRAVRRRDHDAARVAQDEGACASRGNAPARCAS
jgi:hypothetical protein